MSGGPAAACACAAATGATGMGPTPGGESGRRGAHSVGGEPGLVPLAADHGATASLSGRHWQCKRLAAARARRAALAA